MRIPSIMISLPKPEHTPSTKRYSNLLLVLPLDWNITNRPPPQMSHLLREPLPSLQSKWDLSPMSCTRTPTSSTPASISILHLPTLASSPQLAPAPTPTPPAWTRSTRDIRQQDTPQGTPDKILPSTTCTLETDNYRTCLIKNRDSHHFHQMFLEHFQDCPIPLVLESTVLVLAVITGCHLPVMAIDCRLPVLDNIIL